MCMIEIMEDITMIFSPGPNNNNFQSVFLAWHFTPSPITVSANKRSIWSFWKFLVEYNWNQRLNCLPLRKLMINAKRKWNRIRFAWTLHPTLPLIRLDTAKLPSECIKNESNFLWYSVKTSHNLGNFNTHQGDLMKQSWPF